jgi:hypothetical protein
MAPKAKSDVLPFIERSPREPNRNIGQKTGCRGIHSVSTASRRSAAGRLVESWLSMHGERRDYRHPESRYLLIKEFTP